MAMPLPTMPLPSIKDFKKVVDKRVKEIDARADIRHLLLTPVKSLIGSTQDTDSVYYKLCERLESHMYAALDMSRPDPELSYTALKWLQSMGANKINFPLLVQIWNMTDDVAAVMELVKNTGLVPIEDGLAFALSQRANLHTMAQSYKDTSTIDMLSDYILVNKHHWSSVMYRKDMFWVIARY
jgi:hypothetical protein